MIYDVLLNCITPAISSLLTLLEKGLRGKNQLYTHLTDSLIVCLRDNFCISLSFLISPFSVFLAITTEFLIVATFFLSHEFYSTFSTLAHNFFWAAHFHITLTVTTLLPIQGYHKKVGYSSQKKLMNYGYIFCFIVYE